MEFLEEATLWEIGDKVGIYVGLEDNWAEKIDYHWALVQVEMDIKDGILAEIILEKGDKRCL